MIRYLYKNKGQDKIFLFCDIHGHSRNKNIFLYGNDFDNKLITSDTPTGSIAKVLDFCNELKNTCSKNYFSIQSCKYYYYLLI